MAGPNAYDSFEQNDIFSLSHFRASYFWYKRRFVLSKIDMKQKIWGKYEPTQIYHHLDAADVPRTS